MATPARYHYENLLLCRVRKKQREEQKEKEIEAFVALNLPRAGEGRYSASDEQFLDKCVDVYRLYAESQIPWKKIGTRFPNRKLKSLMAKYRQLQKRKHEVATGKGEGKGQTGKGKGGKKRKRGGGQGTKKKKKKEQK